MLRMSRLERVSDTLGVRHQRGASRRVGMSALARSLSDMPPARIEPTALYDDKPRTDERFRRGIGTRTTVPISG